MKKITKTVTVALAAAILFSVLQPIKIPLALASEPSLGAGGTATAICTPPSGPPQSSLLAFGFASIDDPFRYVTS